MFKKFEVGLGINTTQGQEAKHLQTASYTRNSLYKQNWSQAIWYGFNSKLFLPNQQHSLLVFHQHRDTTSYIWIGTFIFFWNIYSFSFPCNIFCFFSFISFHLLYCILFFSFYCCDKLNFPTCVSKDPQLLCYCAISKDDYVEHFSLCGLHFMKEIKVFMCSCKPSPECLRYCL